MSVLMLSFGCALTETSAAPARRRGYLWGTARDLSTLSWLMFRLIWTEEIQMIRLSCF